MNAIPICPEPGCGLDARRPKRFHELGAACPRHAVMRKLREQSADTPTIFDLADSLPARKTYASGKLRPISKADSAAFDNAVMLLMRPYRVIHDERGNSCPHIVWVVLTEHYGPLVITLYTEQSVSYTVFMRFDGTSEQLSRVVQRFGLQEVNPWSGKWNVHDYEPDDALLCFARRLRKCGLTPGLPWSTE